MKNINVKEELIYDYNDTTDFINKSKKLNLKSLGFTLPNENPTKIISLRLPTKLYNVIRAYSTNIDMPYQALIKLILNEGIKNKLNYKKRAQKTSHNI